MPLQDRLLTPHFYLSEFLVHPSTPELVNNPDPKHLAAIQHNAEFLERIRQGPLRSQPIHIDSAYRSPEVNAAVDGVPNSAHMQGHAADIICPSFGDPIEVAIAIQAWLEKGQIAFDQLIFEENAWVHFSGQDDNHGQRRQYLTFDGSNYTDGIHPL